MVKGLSCPKATQEDSEEKIQCTRIKDLCLCQYYVSCYGRYELSDSSEDCLHRKKSTENQRVKQNVNWKNYQ